MKTRAASPSPADPYVPADPAPRGIWTVILASSAGTLIEWYDFYIFGSLATIISGQFFPKGNEVVALLSTLATFATGFIVRPFGALVFGWVGDMVGRKAMIVATYAISGVLLVATGLASAVSAQVDRTNSVLSTSTLNFKVRVQPLGYATTIDIDLSLSATVA